MRKRIVSVLLCIVMVLALMPTSVFAYEAYPIWVTNVRVTDLNKDDVLGDGKVSYDPSTMTLYFKSTTLTEHHPEYGAIITAMLYSGSDTLTVAGDGLVLRPTDPNATGIDTESGNLVITGKVTIDTGKLAVFSRGNVDVSGSSDLTITAKEGSGIFGENVTISGTGDVKISAKKGRCISGSKVTISGSGSANLTSDWDCIFAEKDVTISGTRNVEIHGDENGICTGQGIVSLSNGGLVNITSDKNGIYSSGTIELSGSGYVYIAGKSICIQGTYINLLNSGNVRLVSDSYGIATDEDVTISGSGEVRFETVSRGVFSYGGITLSGDGDVYISSTDSDGMYSYDPVVWSGSGALNITSGSNCIQSYTDVVLSGDGDAQLIAGADGIYTHTSAILSGTGDVTITAGRFGITADQDITISGSGNATVAAQYVGASTGKGVLTISGSGDVEIYGKNNGADFWSDTGKLLLDGTGSSVKLSADSGKKAVYNQKTGKSPVAGKTLSDYKLTGNPASNSAVYTLIREVKDVTIADLDRPVIGKHPDTTVTVTNSHGYPITAAVKWLEYEKGSPKVMSGTDVFKKGLQYTCLITVNTAEGCPFKYSVAFDSHNVPYLTYGGTLTVNGEKLDCKLGDDLLSLSMRWWQKKALPNIPFVDVKEKDYFYEPVAWAVEAGITQGTDATHFSPKDTCTRAQVVTFLWRAAGRPEPTSTKNPFADVQEKDYFYKAVLWAVEKGITQGTDHTHFSPYSPCTRAQVVTFMYRSYKSPSVSRPCPFVDVTSKDYFYNAVLWAIGCDITQGTDPSHFSPYSPCTRAQIVTFLWRDETR